MSTYTIIGTESSFKDRWLTGAARAFWVSAYADALDSFVEGEGCDDCRESNEYCARCEVLADLPQASGGQDWCDVAPETPIAAYVMAGELWARLCANNPDGAGVYSLAKSAASADGVDEDVFDLEAFGFDLAMMAMGTGISWFDDHKEFPIKVPNMDCGTYSFAFENIFADGDE